MNFKISKLSEKLFCKPFRLILKLMLWNATSISRFLRGFFLTLEICVGCGSLKNGQKRYKSKKLIKILWRYYYLYILFYLDENLGLHDTFS